MPDYKDDIEKYRRDELTPAERQRLEKTALSDPFLADALEGSGSLTGIEFSSDIRQLQKKILKHQRGTYFWPLRIAAGIVIIVSSMVIITRLTDEDARDQLALQHHTNDKADQPVNKPADSEKESRDRTHAEPSAPSPVPDQKEIFKVSPTTSEKSWPAKEVPASGLAEQAVQESELREESALNSAPQEKDVVVTDDKNMNSFQGGDKTGPPAMSRSVTSRKKAEAAAEPAPSNADDEQKSVDANVPMPRGGFTQFNEYVADNLRYPQSAIDNNIQGDVVIEFQIDPNGDTKDFVILKGLGFGCDEEAIRLIKDGPKWSPGLSIEATLNSKTSAIIPFILKKKTR